MFPSIMPVYIMFEHSFTLIGVVNKMITILINTLIWDNHASSYGIASLMVCIVGGTIYRQAPLQSEIKNKYDEDRKNDEEETKGLVVPVDEESGGVEMSEINLTEEYGLEAD